MIERLSQLSQAMSASLSVVFLAKFMDFHTYMKKTIVVTAQIYEVSKPF